MANPLITRRLKLQTPHLCCVVASHKPKLWYGWDNFFYREAMLSYGD